MMQSFELVPQLQAAVKYQTGILLWNHNEGVFLLCRNDNPLASGSLQWDHNGCKLPLTGL